MSEIIKLNMKRTKLNVSLKNPFEASNFETEREEDYFHNQLKQHYEHGYAEGQKAAQEKLEKEYSEKLIKKYAELQTVFEEVDRKMIEYRESYEKLVVNLAISVAEKIVKREINQGAIINEILHEALRRVIGANRIIIKINPVDLEILNKESGDMFNDDSFSKIKFETDVKVEQGGCLVETEIGNVDARIASQFGEVKRNLEAIFTNEED